MFGRDNYVNLKFDVNSIVKTEDILKMFIGEKMQFETPIKSKLVLITDTKSIVMENMYINDVSTEPSMRYNSIGTPFNTVIELGFARAYNTQPTIIENVDDDIDTLNQIQALVDKLNAKGTKVKSLRLINGDDKEIKIIPKNA